MKQLRSPSSRKAGFDAPKAQTEWSGRRKALAAPGPTPPGRGGEYLERKVEQQQEIREELRETLRRYEELYDLAPVGFVTLDKRGLISGLNERTARLLAFPMQWLRERPFLVFVSSGDVGRFLGVLSRLR